MDNSWLVDSLDCLWFFSDVFRPRNAHGLSSNNDNNAVTESVKMPANEDPSKPGSQILQNIERKPQSAERSDPIACRKSSPESAAEIEPVTLKPAESDKMDSPRSTEKEERRRSKRRSRSKRSLKHQSRKIFGELDLCFEVNEVSETRMFEENRWCCQIHGNQKLYWMPPFDDNIAMKEHLKSWAYAVACTVK